MNSEFNSFASSFNYIIPFLSKSTTSCFEKNLLVASSPSSISDSKRRGNSPLQQPIQYDSMTLGDFIEEEIETISYLSPSRCISGRVSIESPSKLLEPQVAELATLAEYNIQQDTPRYIPPPENIVSAFILSDLNSNTCYSELEKPKLPKIKTEINLATYVHKMYIYKRRLQQEEERQWKCERRNSYAFGSMKSFFPNGIRHEYDPHLSRKMSCMISYEGRRNVSIRRYNERVSAKEEELRIQRKKESDIKEIVDIIRKDRAQSILDQVGIPKSETDKLKSTRNTFRKRTE